MEPDYIATFYESSSDENILNSAGALINTYKYVYIYMGIYIYAFLRKSASKCDCPMRTVE